MVSLTVHASFIVCPPAQISPFGSKYLSTLLLKSPGLLYEALQVAYGTIPTVTCFCGLVGASFVVKVVWPHPDTTHLKCHLNIREWSFIFCYLLIVGNDNEI